MDIHSHYTAGLASMSILKGIEAGADIVDTAMSPLALGTSHMPTESLVAALRGTDYDTGLDLNQLNVVRAISPSCAKSISPAARSAPRAGAWTPTPDLPGAGRHVLQHAQAAEGRRQGGQAGRSAAEIPRVREDAGYPPLVTPTSQIVGTQAVFNVILGERYKMVTKEFKGLIHGDYGKTPAPIKPAFSKQIWATSSPSPAALRHPGAGDGQAEGRGRQVVRPGGGCP